jgi:outer membrane beta-barrel protein
MGERFSHHFAVFVLACCVVQPARAESPAADLSTLEASAVRNRLFQVEKRFEIGADVSFQLVPRLIDVANFTLSVAYNPFEWLGVELRAGYAYSASTQLAQDIRTKYQSNSESQASDLTDNWALKANAVLGARFQPIYGKVNIVSALAIHFQFYLWAGAGVASLQKESIVLCAEGDRAACSNYVKSSRVAPVLGTAIGARFWLPTAGQRHGIKLEIRSLSFQDTFTVDAERAAVSPENPTGNGRTQNGQLTHVPQLDIGYAFIF